MRAGQWGRAVRGLCGSMGISTPKSVSKARAKIYGNELLEHQPLPETVDLHTCNEKLPSWFGKPRSCLAQTDFECCSGVSTRLCEGV